MLRSRVKVTVRPNMVKNHLAGKAKADMVHSVGG